MSSYMKGQDNHVQHKNFFIVFKSFSLHNKYDPFAASFSSRAERIIFDDKNFFIPLM